MPAFVTPATWIVSPPSLRTLLWVLNTGAPFVALAFIEDGYRPLTDLDALYGVHGPPMVQVQPAPAFDAAPADLVDDTPAMVAWANPPLDAK